jgi:prepilin-type N-terminal cleavage/methylation domain-containing protein
VRAMRTSLQISRPRGFSLIEIAVVLFIIAILIAMAAAITRGVTAAQKRSLTATRMATVDAAILQFVTTQRRLPCPADGTLASANNNAGVETARTSGAGCTSDQSNGVVPWRALALTELEMTDGWDRRLTYRVSPALAADAGMDMTWCDAAGTNPTAGPVACSNACVGTNMATCTPPSAFLLNKGLQVRSLNGTVLMNPAVTNPHSGAAYVVISHGESGGGGYLNGGVLGASTVTDGTEEARNYASAAYAGAGTYYVDDTTSEASGVGHFDDIVSRPSVMGVITKAGLGPRAH